MSEKIRIAIVGYGNIGRGVRSSIKKNPDMELGCIISRAPERVKSELGDNAPMLIDANEINYTDAAEEIPLREEADVAILCGGSKNDLPVQGWQFAKLFNTVDSFDTHADIPKYFEKMDGRAKAYNHVSVVCAGWDPGTFSLERVLMDAFIPGARPQMFYGLDEKGGLSMGHSDAVRQLRDLGVMDARQYTHGIHEAIDRVRSGENPDLKAGERVWREVYVVAKEGADKAAIEKAIKTMPAYFDEYKTEVHFVSQEELKEKHSGMPHDGLVLAVGETGEGNRAMIEYKNEWQSNPEATGNILIACARAAYRLNKEGKTGAFAMLDIPAAYLSPRPREELLRDFM